jgi:hypothetical protein
MIILKSHDRPMLTMHQESVKKTDIFGILGTIGKTAIQEGR